MVYRVKCVVAIQVGNFNCAPFIKPSGNNVSVYRRFVKADRRGRKPCCRVVMNENCGSSPLIIVSRNFRALGKSPSGPAPL